MWRVDGLTMVRKPVTFLNTEYKTQGEFGNFVKNFIEEIGICNDVKNVYKDKYSILIKILERHPNWNSKSENMRNIKISRNVLNKKALEIHIIKDDEEIDISWRCAITGKDKSKKSELIEAMRVSVIEQTQNFRENSDIYCCELCGNKERLDVDHNDEKNSAFDELAFNFIKENSGIKIPDNFGELNDGTYRRCFLEKDYVFKETWIKYHRNHAILRMLCHTCNINRPKTKKKLVL